MITRRSVRIKTMQTVYAYEQTEDAPIIQFTTQLLRSIESAKDQYLYILLMIREIANYVEQDAQIKANKFLKTDADKNFNTKLLSNLIIQHLNHDEAFNKIIKDKSMATLVNADEVKAHYRKFIETPDYQRYLHVAKEFDWVADRDLLLFLIEDFLLQQELFLHNIDEYFINWNDDAFLVIDAIKEALKKKELDFINPINSKKVNAKIHELSDFGMALFRHTIQEKEETLTLIEPKLNNWETERLAILDVILLRMAVTEFRNFPSIPVKVTINEYLDIAKEYSTPKSKDFINGVLDSIQQELRQKQQLNKTGRGLV